MTTPTTPQGRHAASPAKIDEAVAARYGNRYLVDEAPDQHFLMSGWQP
jgi:hypothetical protein